MADQAHPAPKLQVVIPLDARTHVVARTGASAARIRSKASGDIEAVITGRHADPLAVALKSNDATGFIDATFEAAVDVVAWRRLFEAGARPSADRLRGALVGAVQAGDTDAIRLLIENGAKPAGTLMSATTPDVDDRPQRGLRAAEEGRWGGGGHGAVPVAVAVAGPGQRGVR